VWWLTPIILAVWEAEMGSMLAWANKILSQPIKAGLGGTHLSSSYKKSRNRRTVVHISLGIKSRLYLKKKKKK
jgi:hypothetical protein